MGKAIQKCVPLKKLVPGAGQYFLVVEGRIGSEKAAARESFFIQFTDESTQFVDARTATPMGALKYICAPKDFANMANATGEERIERLAAA